LSFISEGKLFTGVIDWLLLSESFLTTEESILIVGGLFKLGKWILSDAFLVIAGDSEI
jgi:hypothetical protein